MRSGENRCLKRDMAGVLDARRADGDRLDGSRSLPREVASTSTLLIHAKAPLPGLAKSRLLDPARGHDDDFVARLSDAFLRDTLDHASRGGADEIVLHYTPELAAPYFRALLESARLEPQPEVSFGERLITAFARCFARGAGRVVAIGMDTPHLEASTIARAFEALDRTDVVIGPAEDGGYYLIGMRRRIDLMFEDIDWSTDRVAAQTRARARACGATIVELGVLFDVDRPEDLARLRELAIDAPTRCPRTAALLGIH